MRHSAEAVVVIGDGAAAPIFSLKAMASIIPEIFRGSSTPTFTRATTAYDSDWENRLVQVLAGEPRFTGARRVANLMPQFSNVAWTHDINITRTTGVTDPSGGTTAITATATSTGPDACAIYGQISTVGTGTYCSSIYVRRRTGVGTVKLRPADNGTGVDITSQLTSSWKRFSVPNASGAFSPLILFTLSVSGDAIDLAFPQIEFVQGQSNQNPSEYVSVGVLSAPYHGAGVDGVQYFTTLNGNTVASNVVTEATGLPICPANGASSATTDANGPLGYLAEGARTNLCLQSQTLQTTWATQNTAAVVADQYVAPDGTTTADKLQTTAANTFFRYIQAVSGGLSATTYTYSVYLRYTNHRWAYLMIFDSASASNVASFDLLNGAAGAVSSGVTSTITSTAIAGVYRVSMTYTAPLGAANLYIGFNTSDSATPQTWNAAGTETLGAWGAQLEAASFASTYIPTTTVAVARNADVLTYAASGNISGIVGSCYAEVTLPSTNSDAAYSALGIVDSDDNQSGTNGAPLYVGLGSLRVYDGASRVGNAISVSSNAQKIASRWGGSVINTALAGVASSDLTFDGDLGLNANFAVGSDRASAQIWGTIKNVRIYGTALSAAQLQAMTA